MDAFGSHGAENTLTAAGSPVESASVATRCALSSLFYSNPVITHGISRNLALIAQHSLACNGKAFSRPYTSAGLSRSVPLLITCCASTRAARSVFRAVRAMGSSAPEYSVAGAASDEDTTVYLEVALRVARGAGELIKAGFLQPKGDYDRKSVTDPVTDTDRATEAYILRQIRSAFPKHRFIGEESAPDEKWTDEPTWIVDPIDGTANFGTLSAPRGCRRRSDGDFFLSGELLSLTALWTRICCQL
jgi:hypothetical protein